MPSASPEGLPLIHLRMADFQYGFTHLSQESLSVVTAHNGTYKLAHDSQTTISLTLKQSNRVHRQKTGFIPVRGLQAAVIRSLNFIPSFVVTWRNSETSLLVYVPLSRNEVLHLFPLTPKEQRFSIIECPSVAPAMLRHFAQLPRQGNPLN